MTISGEPRRRIRRNAVLLALLAFGVYGGYYLVLMWRDTG